MPIYEYQCAACDHVEEVLQKMSDPPPARCSKCSKGPMEKLLSQTAFHLKGGGWYSDAYSSKAKAESKPGAPAVSMPTSGDSGTKPAVASSSESPKTASPPDKKSTPAKSSSSES